MDIADIYEKFDQIGCLTFAAIDKDTSKNALLTCSCTTIKDYIFLLGEYLTV